MINIRKKYGILILAMLFSLHAIGNAANKPSDIPLDVFGKHPYIKSPELSPDGKHIVALVSVNGVYQVGVADFEKRQLKLVYKVAQHERSQINAVDWANNSRLIIRYSYLRNTLNVITSSGRDLRYTRMIALNKDGSDVKYLEYKLPKSITKMTPGRKSRKHNPIHQTDVIDFLPKDKDHILIQLDGGVDWNVEHVYKLNVYTAKYTQIQKNFQNIYNWITDRKGKLRLGIARDKNSKYRKEYYYRENESSKWKRIMSYTLFKDAINLFKGFDATGKKLYFISNKDYDKGALYLFDPKTKTMSEPIYNHDKVQISGLFYDYS